MTFKPITEKDKDSWISWLQGVAKTLDGKSGSKYDNATFETDNGDLQTGKDLVGVLLATLTDSPITIN